MGLHSLIHNLTTKDAVPASPAVQGDKPTKKELYRNRFQFGPNIGAMFVAEKWIDNSLYTDKAKGDSELSALKGAKASGDSIDTIRGKWDEHYKNFLGPDDWKYLQSRGVTAIRLPIGFWNVNGGKFTKGTDFAEFGDVYKNSWKYILDVIHAAGDANIGVLVDFHGVPGGANADAHSGTDTGKADFWHNSGDRDIALEAYVWAAKELDGIENVVGLQLINEAPYGQDKLKSFYLDAISKVRKVARDLPLVISDAWDLDGWRKLIKQYDDEVSSPSKPESIGVVIDTHVYRLFSDEDKKKSADDHVKSACQCVPPDDDVDVMVGEFSCCLSDDSWNKCGGDRGELEVRYGQEQVKCFEKSARAGAYFWTYKFQQGEGGSWDFRVMSDKGALPAGASNRRDGPDFNQALEQALGNHKNYWDNQDKNQDWEHWRFEDGFRQGYEDAKAFAEFNGSRLGRIAAWKTARLAQHIKAKGNSDKTFVYSQAFVQGVDAFWS